MLNEEMFYLMLPLLSAQDYIKSVAIHDGGAVDYDLDVFRSSPLPIDRINLSRLYLPFLGIALDLTEPWLKVPPDTSFSDCVILARSSRYHNCGINYKLMSGRTDVVFVGIEEEYLQMKENIPGLHWHPVRDFLEMAAIISGAKAFIGNQSLPYAIAEGLKVPRILEVDPSIPNVVPSGRNGYEAFFQRQFEYLVSRVAGRSVSSQLV